MGARAAKLTKIQRKTSNDHKRKQSIEMGAISTLSDNDYVYLMEQTNLSKKEIKEMFEKFVESSTDGELNHDEFVSLFKSLSTDEPEYLDKHSEFIFDSFDRDHNGRISFKEFLIAYALLSKGDLEKKIEYTFTLYDLDNNGYLDIDEVFRAISRIFQILNGERKIGISPLQFAENIVRELDVYNRDGLISKGKALTFWLDLI
jgi:neuronal calcium sensor 1